LKIFFTPPLGAGGLLLLFLWIMGACSTTMNKKEIIARKWRVESIEVIPAVQDTAQPIINSNDNLPKKYKIWYDFKANGIYVCQRGNMKDEGEWQLSTDEKVLLLKSTQNSKDDASWWIEELNRYQIMLSTQERGKKEIIKLSPEN
jgi:hypothetical protein